MGTKDSKAKEYLSDNTRFSEICNYVLFDGEKVIKPEDLKECDTTEVLSVFGIDKKQIVKQKWRDLLKSVSVKHTGQMYVILIGAEAQTDIHYAMPVKTMIYDALNYGEQVNEAKKCHWKNKDYRSSDEFLSGFTLDDKLTPVITITLYLGTTQWDGPRSLAEMMPQMDERILPFINDYRINLLNPLEITDFSKFETGLRPLFELLKNASDEEKLNDLITKDETFTRVDVETVAAINLFVGTDIKYDEKEEVAITVILLSYQTTPIQEFCSPLFALRLRSHLMTYLLSLRPPRALIYHPEQVNILQGIFLVAFLAVFPVVFLVVSPPECHAFYDHPMPYTYLPPLPFHHT